MVTWPHLATKSRLLSRQHTAVEGPIRSESMDKHRRFLPPNDRLLPAQCCLCLGKEILDRERWNFSRHPFYRRLPSHSLQREVQSLRGVTNFLRGLSPLWRPFGPLSPHRLGQLRDDAMRTARQRRTSSPSSIGRPKRGSDLVSRQCDIGRAKLFARRIFRDAHSDRPGDSRIFCLPAVDAPHENRIPKSPQR